MLSHVVQRFANDLQKLAGSPFFQNRKVSTNQSRVDTTVPLEMLDGFTNCGLQIIWTDIGRLHSSYEGTEFRHLCAPEILQLHQLAHSGVDIAFQQFANDLQAHLKADEA